MSFLPYASGIFSVFFSDVGYSYGSFPQSTRENARVVAMAGVPGGSGEAYDDAPPPIETVRTFFPETWIWDLVEKCLCKHDNMHEQR